MHHLINPHSNSAQVQLPSSPLYGWETFLVKMKQFAQGHHVREDSHLGPLMLVSSLKHYFTVSAFPCHCRLVTSWLFSCLRQLTSSVIPSPPNSTIIPDTRSMQTTPSRPWPGSLSCPPRLGSSFPGHLRSLTSSKPVLKSLTQISYSDHSPEPLQPNMSPISCRTFFNLPRFFSPFLPSKSSILIYFRFPKTGFPFSTRSLVTFYNRLVILYTMSGT